MLKRWAGSFYVRAQPWVTRQSYVHERVTSATLPVAGAMVEGGVMGVLARKAFDVPAFLFAAIMAAPMFANLTSFFWARLARGKRKVYTITFLQVAMAGCVGMVALLPTTWPGPYLLTGLVILARCMICGVVTLRSTVWRMNYPRHVRGQVTGRLSQLNTMMLTLAPLAGYPLLDWEPELFRVLYPAAMAVAMVGAGSFSKIRLRGERSLLQYERGPTARPEPHGDAAPIYEYDPQSEETAGFWQVLRRDWRFRRYMSWQFVAGMANMMGEVSLIYYVSQLTEGMRFEYLGAIVLTTTLPMGLAMVTLPVWARKLDQMHIAKFRVRQSAFWILCQLGHWGGAAMGSLTVLIIPRVMQGVARGGGMLAWNLGHNDFADRKLVALYMGIHVTLTGIRGAIGPFIAMALLTGWNPIGFTRIGTLLPGFAGIGPHVFAVTTVLAAVAMGGFHVLYQAIRRESEAGQAE
jgi:MFS family permease